MTAELLEWFEKNKRELPWRKNRSPYRVWLSEIMLQQTQVKTVMPYFNNWLDHFPDVQSLAKASLDDVLKQWEGLGYYRRAKNLYKAANIVTFELEGQFPTTYNKWLELPGVGPYSAAAISSIVNNEAVAAVDGNVKRVAARLFLLEGKLNEKEVQRTLNSFVSTDQPGAFNEAMMELGATLCKKQTPDCLNCPISKYCKAYIQKRTQEFPTPTVKTKRPHHEKYAVIDIKDDKIWLRQRSESEMLNGLWGFVLKDEVDECCQKLERVSHAYTHFSLGVTPTIDVATQEDGCYVLFNEIENLALSTLDHKILNVVHQYREQTKL